MFSAKAELIDTTDRVARLTIDKTTRIRRFTRYKPISGSREEDCVSANRKPAERRRSDLKHFRKL